MNKEKTREILEKVLYENSGDVYDCTRVWAAWSYGTMSSNDFLPFEERVPDIVEEMIKEIFGEE